MCRSVHVYTCIHIYMDIYMDIYIYIPTHICIYARACIYIYLAYAPHKPFSIYGSVCIRMYAQISHVRMRALLF